MPKRLIYSVFVSECLERISNMFLKRKKRQWVEDDKVKAKLRKTLDGGSSSEDSVVVFKVLPMTV